MNEILIAVIPVVIIGIICAGVLVIASKLMAVKEDERFPAVRDCLPGANCGACGFAGCDGYAKALCEDPDTPANLCIPGAASVANQLAEVLGVEVGDVVELRRLSAYAGQGRLQRHRDLRSRQDVLRRQGQLHLWLSGLGRLPTGMSPKRDFYQGRCGAGLHLRLYRLRRLRQDLPQPPDLAGSRHQADGGSVQQPRQGRRDAQGLLRRLYRLQKMACTTQCIKREDLRGCHQFEA